MSKIALPRVGVRPPQRALIERERYEMREGRTLGEFEGNIFLGFVMAGGDPTDAEAFETWIDAVDLEELSEWVRGQVEDPTTADEIPTGSDSPASLVSGG